MSNSSNLSSKSPSSSPSSSTRSKSEQEVLALREMLTLVLPMVRAPRTGGEMAILNVASRLCEGPKSEIFSRAG